MNNKIREITEGFRQKSLTEEDAMFSKKPFGPSNCASCDKGLINLIGKPVDHYNHKRLP